MQQTSSHTPQHRVTLCGGWPDAVALTAVLLLLVSLIIAYLAIRTLLLLLRGQLLPQNLDATHYPSKNAATRCAESCGSSCIKQ
jgi:hypothetical protein